MRGLYAVSVAAGGVLCPDCATEEFDEDLENLTDNDGTHVLDDDDWRHEVDGPCAKCGNEVGE